MENIVLALAPALAAGFAVQRLLELLDPLYPKLGNVFVKDKTAPIEPSNKARVLGLVSLIAGILIALFGGVRVLKFLGTGVVLPDAVDALVTGLLISTGTD